MGGNQSSEEVNPASSCAVVLLPTGPVIISTGTALERKDALISE